MTPYIGELVTNLTQQGPQGGMVQAPMIDPALLQGGPQYTAGQTGLVRGYTPQMHYPPVAQPLPPPWQFGPSFGYCPPGYPPQANGYGQWVQNTVSGAPPLLATNVGVRPYRDGEGVVAMPTRWSDQQIGLGSTTLAAGATANITVTNSKRGMVRGLKLFSDAGGVTTALVNSITASGQTLVAGSQAIPGAFFANVDSFGNLSSPELLPNSPLVINVTNPTAVPITVLGAFVFRTAE